MPVFNRLRVICYEWQEQEDEHNHRLQTIAGDRIYAFHVILLPAFKTLLTGCQSGTAKGSNHNSQPGWDFLEG
jgi:hypothetical protein